MLFRSFDGRSYQLDWPGAARNTATSIQIGSVKSGGIGPLSSSDDGDDYDQPYPIIQLETDVSASETACQSNGVGCVVPPIGARFYPFYSLATGGFSDDSGNGQGCTLLFGDFNGFGFRDFGRDAQYGPSNLPWFFGQNSGGPISNPCIPHPRGDSEQ